MRLRYFLFFVPLLLVLPAQAKGPADRIIVTGPTIDGEVILTSPEAIYPLSFALLEDFSAGAVAEPARPGDIYYELERQFRANKTRFLTFDRSRFYPESGDVYYLGIEGGSSEYDQKWFHARPEAGETLATLFDPLVHPALVLMQGGEIQLVDAATLAQVSVLDLPGPVDHLRGFVDGPDASTFDVTGELMGGAETSFRVDLASREVCSVPSKRIAAAEAIGIPWVVADIVSRQNRDFAGASFASVDAFSEGRVLLYQPDFTTAGDNLPGGILVFSLDRGRQLDQWLSDHRFSQVIAGGEQLYALESAADATLLLQLQASDGRILNTRMLPGQAWSVGYGLFDLSAVDRAVIELRMCRP